MMLDTFFQYLAYISDHNVFSFGGTPVYHISQACSETSPYWLFSALCGFARARFFNLLDVSSRSDFLLSRNRIQPPVPQTALSAALRAMFPQHPIPH